MPNANAPYTGMAALAEAEMIRKGEKGGAEHDEMLRILDKKTKPIKVEMKYPSEHNHSNNKVTGK